jgi:hypothetical protein
LPRFWGRGEPAVPDDSDYEIREFPPPRKQPTVALASLRRADPA